MKQSKRRMQVARKRLARGKDALRRPVTFSKEDIYFWDWIINASYDEYSWFRFSAPKQAGLIGGLPGNRRLTKPLAVNLVWDSGEWLISEPTYHMHANGPTIHKAIASFRRIFSHYLDILSEREDQPMAQHLHDQLAYLREMIEVKQA